MRERECGIERKRAVIARDRVLVAPQVPQGRTTVAPVLKRIRRQRQSLIVASDRLDRTAELGEDIGAVAMSVGERGFTGDRGIEARERLSRASQPAQRETDEIVRPALLRAGGERLPRQFDPALKLALPARRLGEAEQRICIGNGSSPVHRASLSATGVHPAIGRCGMLEFSRRMREKYGSSLASPNVIANTGTRATTCGVVSANTWQISIDPSLHLES